MRVSSAISGTAAAVATFSGLADAFSATSKTNVVTYWGQGHAQDSLQSVCKNPNVDIVNIAFVNVFPDQGAGGYPGTNFGNACGDETYTVNNTKTQLLSNCPNVGADIEICQRIYGKKVFLSLGGAYPTNYFIKDSNSAVNFANFLWSAFGPQASTWDGPRPFGDAVVDGFDFDIESDLSKAPVVDGRAISDYKTRGYAKMITTLKSTLFPKDTSKSYYISGAPQCVVPDQHFAGVVNAAWFDFLFVQYYNTASCSARQAITSGTFKGYSDWASVPSLNTNVKLYVGLAASTAASSDASFYLSPSEVKTLISKVYSNSRFGGIMLWEATYAARNIICNKDYATWTKQILEAQAAGTSLKIATNPCPAQPISKDGTCGGYTGSTCAGSIFGSCCSIYGYCGNSADYCNAATCDPKGGKCGAQYVTSSVKTSSTSSMKISSSSSQKISSSSSLKISSTSSLKISSTSSKQASSVSSKKISSSTKAATTSQKVSSSTKQSSSVKPVSVTRKALFGAIDNNSTAAAGTAPILVGTGASSIVDASSTAPIIIGSASSSVTAINDGQASTVGSVKLAPSGGFPVVAPYSNSTRSTGAVDANANFRIVPTTIYSTSTVYQTVVQTVTRTNAQGAVSTEYMTETVKVYTTVFAVATQTPSANEASENNNSGSNSGPSDSGSSDSDSSSNSGSSNSGNSDSEVADQSGQSFYSDVQLDVANDVRYTAVTKTIYTTAYVTATVQQKAVTYTSAYALTSVEYAAKDMTTSTTTMLTTRTHTAYQSAAPFAFTNGTAVLRVGPSGSPAPVNLNAAASSSSSSSATPIVVVQTQVIVPVAAAQSSLASSSSAPAAAAAQPSVNSRVYGTANFTTPQMKAAAMEMKSVAMKGAASSMRIELGTCMVALIIGSLFII